MPYFVKWKLHGQDQVLSNELAYPRASDAMDFACGVLGQKPNDVWVEDEHGSRIADEIKIIRHCMKPTKNRPTQIRSGRTSSTE